MALDSPGAFRLHFVVAIGAFDGEHFPIIGSDCGSGAHPTPQTGCAISSFAHPRCRSAKTLKFRALRRG
jgi:hypothetical protein